MKNIAIYTALILAGILGVCRNASAQSTAPSGPERKDEIKGIVLNKTIRPKEDDETKTMYTIRLDSYVTGASQSTIKEVAKPVDLVLVLDVSGSMDDLVNVTYTAKSANYTYNSYGNQSLYFLYNNNYYKVSRGTNDNKNRYNLHFSVGNTTYYIQTDGSVTTNRQNAQQSNKTDTIYKGILYEQNGDKKIDLLNDAVKNFIQTVYDKTKGPDETRGTDDDVDHRIGIATFSPQLSAKHCDYDQQYGDRNKTWYGAETVTNLLSVASKKSTLDNYVKFVASGGTLSSGGLHHADLIFGAQPATDYTGENARSKVVVMFTDGVPGMSGWSTDEANRAINVAKTLKAAGATVYTIGIFDNLGDNEENVSIYMNYVSSNYPNAENMTTPGANPVVDGNFYQRSNGSDLSAIFQKIAEHESSGSATVTVDNTSAAIIDVVSNNFVIPEGTTRDDIRVWVESCYADPATSENPWATEADEEHYYYTDHKPSGDDIVIDGNSLTVKGFNYSQDDVRDAAGNITEYGNWVGPRTVNDETDYYGNKLVIEFDIKLNESYAGGLEMPSNDLTSGMYIDTDGDGTYDEYMPYPKPNVDFPSVCIMKDGLQYGESAIFTLTGKDSEGEATDEVYHMMLSQKKSNGMLEPCYKTIKTLDTGFTYTVTEDSWSWMYMSTDPTPDTETSIVSLTYTLYNIPSSVYTGYEDAKEYILTEGTDLQNCGVVVGRQKDITVNGQTATYCVLKDTLGEYNNTAVSILFHFTNEYNTENKPARSEAFKSNEFRGGTSGGGGSTGGGTDEGGH